MKVCLIGLGYIGLPTACILARAGHQVLGVDTNQSVVDNLSNGTLHIVNEPSLADLADAMLHSGRLCVSTTPEGADVFVLAVPTPCLGVETEPGPGANASYADLSHVESATRAIAPFIRTGNLVIVESTVPPGTTEKVVQKVLSSEGVDCSKVLLAHAPERVLPGNIIYELVHNDRVVGGLTPEAGQAAYSFYNTFVEGEIIVTNSATAELVKLMENTFRDVNIALANEFAQVCCHLGIDVWEAVRLANRHPRVNYLQPGPGVGGHCIAVDPYFVIQAAPTVTSLVQTARQVNRSMPHFVMESFHSLIAGTFVQKVALLGAAYKANVEDDRESPTFTVARLLSNAGYTVVVHDPHVARFRQPIASTLQGVDTIVLMTDHAAYQQLEPDAVAQLVRSRLLLDTRGFFKVRAWRAAGFRVARLGSGLPDKIPVGD